MSLKVLRTGRILFHNSYAKKQIEIFHRLRNPEQRQNLKSFQFLMSYNHFPKDNEKNKVINSREL